MAKQLSEEGYAITVTGRNLEKLDELTALGMTAVKWDLSLAQSEAAWPDEVKRENFDCVILNAGIGYFKSHDELTEAETEEMFRVNTLLPIQLSAFHSRIMQKRGSGHLLFIGSLAAKMATPKASVYAATKHALDGYVQGLRMELQKSPVSVSILHPGPIDTAFIDKADTTGQYKTSLAGHLMTAEQVGNRVIQLIHDPKGEVLLPKHLAFAAKFSQLAPLLVEKWGRRFYAKK